MSISVGQIGRIVRGEAWKEYSQIGTTESEVFHRMAKNEGRDWKAEAKASLEKLKAMGVVEAEEETSSGFSRLEAELNKLPEDLSKQAEDDLNKFLGGLKCDT